MSEKNKNFNDDTVFNKINKMFVSLSAEEIKENNIHLTRVIDKLIAHLSTQNDFFKRVYQKISFCGSYYKKTKVGRPNEYDLNIIIKLPIKYEHMKIIPCSSGFVQIHSGLNSNEYVDRNVRILLTEDMYLDQNKFRNWMESTLHKIINKLPQQHEYYILDTDVRRYKIRVIKSGPAFTLYIEVSYDKIICVDLVPVLEFSQQIPNLQHNLTFFKKTTWYAVPKPLDRYESYKLNNNLYWRTCFYEQEKEILSGNGKIKPVLRQIKKLRDTQNWKRMASYYIETIFLHACDENVNLQEKSCTFLFMMMLQKLYNAVEDKCIPYYWNTNMNLLFKFKNDELENIKGRLKHIIRDINVNINYDPYIIASYVLNESEQLELRSRPNESELLKLCSQPNESELLHSYYHLHESKLLELHRQLNKGEERNKTDSNTWKCTIQ